MPCARLCVRLVLRLGVFDVKNSLGKGVAMRFRIALVMGVVAAAVLVSVLSGQSAFASSSQEKSRVFRMGVAPISCDTRAWLVIELYGSRKTRQLMPVGDGKLVLTVRRPNGRTFKRAVRLTIGDTQGGSGRLSWVMNLRAGSRIVRANTEASWRGKAPRLRMTKGVC